MFIAKLPSMRRVLAESTAAGEHLHSKFAELERTLMTARDILQKERDELAAQVCEKEV
jgi:hypothetical protein